MCRVKTLRYTCGHMSQHVLSTCLGNKRRGHGQVYCKVRAGNLLSPSSTLVVRIPGACAPCQKKHRLDIIKGNLFDKLRDAPDAQSTNEALDKYNQMAKEFEEMCPRDDFHEKAEPRPGLPPRQDVPKPSPLCEPAQETRRMLVGYESEPVPPRKLTKNLTYGFGSLVEASKHLDREDITEGPKIDPRTYEQLVAAEKLRKARRKLLQKLGRKEAEKRQKLQDELEMERARKWMEDLMRNTEGN